jgi:hypothetical protein
MGKPGGKQPFEHKTSPESRAQVKAFCCVGFPQERIAKYFEISVETLQKHYPDELRTALDERLGKISEVAYQRALDGNDKMLDLILRTQARWSNPQPVQQVVLTSKSELEDFVKSRGIEVEVPRGTDADAK